MIPTYPQSRRPLRALMLAGLLVVGLRGTVVVGAQTFCTHGDPTAPEQYLLEILNRARANPGADGDRMAAAVNNDADCQRIYRVHPGDLGRMNADFHAMAARPPVGFNSSLLVSSHQHNQDMTATGVFSFNGSDGSTLNSRIAAAGYPSTLISGNIAGGQNTVFGIHYSFATDLDQPGMGHRHNVMNDNTWYVFREVGLAVGDLDLRPKGAYVTEDFGNAGIALATGVSFRDYDNDDFYTVGEGLAGMVVTSPASSRFTVTTASGGYSLPLDLLPDFTAGTQSVDLVFANLNGQVISRQTVALSGSTQGGGFGRAYDNVKVDLVYNGDGSLRSPGVPAVDQGVVSVVGTPARGGFVVSRAGSVDVPLTMLLYHNGGSAIRGQDYLAFRGTLTLAAGQTEAVIPVTLLPGANRGKKVKVFLDPSPNGEYQIGKAQSKVLLSDLP